jgi:hypothetical protein
MGAGGKTSCRSRDRRRALRLAPAQQQALPGLLDQQIANGGQDERLAQPTARIVLRSGSFISGSDTMNSVPCTLTKPACR